MSISSQIRPRFEASFAASTSVCRHSSSFASTLLETQNGSKCNPNKLFEWSAVSEAPPKCPPEVYVDFMLITVRLKLHTIVNQHTHMNTRKKKNVRQRGSHALHYNTMFSLRFPKSSENAQSVLTHPRRTLKAFSLILGDVLPRERPPCGWDYPSLGEWGSGWLARFTTGMPIDTSSSISPCVACLLTAAC